VAGTANITGQLTAPLIANNLLNTVTLNASGTGSIGILNTNYISTNYVKSVTVEAPIINTSSITVSTINGLPYNPGGPNASGIFSTMLVSSLTTTSSLTVTGVTNTPTINTNTLSTFTAKASNITSGSIQFGTIGTPTTLGLDGSIFNPIQGSINLSTAKFSTLTTSSITTRSINANTISTQELLISTVNGLTYPPPFNSTIQGNLYVTSTLTAHDIDSATTILATGNITSATGDMIAINAQFNQITSLGNITASALLSGALGGIGGVTLGATSVGRNIGDIYGRDLKVSSITTSQNSIFNAPVNITSGGLYTKELFMLNGAITNLSSINGVTYPPFIPTQSTFNQIFTSSLQASTITTSGLATTAGLTNLGNISTTSINLPQINIGVIAGQISSATIKSLSFDTINLTAVAGGMSSLTVSTINNLPYPPSAGANSVFSTIVVSSIATVGSISAGGGNVGGVTFPGGGVASGAIITANTLNANIGINSVQFLSTPIVNATNYISTPRLFTSTINAPNGNFFNVSTNNLHVSTIENKFGPFAGQSYPITFVNTPLQGYNTGVTPGFPNTNVRFGGNIDLGINSLTGGASSAIFLSTSIVSGNPNNITYISPSFIQVAGAYNSGIQSEFAPTGLTVENTTSTTTTVGAGAVSLFSAVGAQPAMALTANNIQNATNINTTQVTNTNSIQQYGNAINYYLGGILPPPPYGGGGGFAPTLFGQFATSSWSSPPGVFYTSGTSYDIPNLYIPYTLDSSCPAFIIRLGLVSNGSRAGYGPQIQGMWDIMTYPKDVGGRFVGATTTIVFANSVIVSANIPGNNNTTMSFTPTQGGAPANDVFNLSITWMVTRVA
jgi:hypothetical protein